MIQRHENFNIGGISKIEIAPFFYFESITGDFLEINSTSINFNTGKNWNEIYFTPDTAKYTDKQKQTKSGELYSHSLTFKIPKTRKEVYQELINYFGVRCIVKITDNNNNSLLLGDKTEGLRLYFSTSIPKNTNNYNGTYITIKGNTTFPARFINF